jgi:hypothetical protein
MKSEGLVLRQPRYWASGKPECSTCILVPLLEQKFLQRFGYADFQFATDSGTARAASTMTSLCVLNYKEKRAKYRL